MICTNCLRKEEVKEILFWHFEAIIECLELEEVLNVISNLSNEVVQCSIQSGFEHFQEPQLLWAMFSSASSYFITI